MGGNAWQTGRGSQSNLLLILTLDVIRSLELPLVLLQGSQTDAFRRLLLGLLQDLLPELVGNGLLSTPFPPTHGFPSSVWHFCTSSAT